MSPITHYARELLRRLGWLTGLKRAAIALGLRHRFLRLRSRGYALLSGEGLEIGAFEHPAKLPRRCRVRYADVLTPEEAARRFPEIDASRLVPIDLVVDLDRDGLSAVPDASLDFVIACHVIEHVANPGRLVAEMIRVTKPGGHVVIAAPDKTYTFDHRRASTVLGELERFFHQGRPPVGPEDYREMIHAVHPELLSAPEKEQRLALETFFRRREHLSVWTDAEFRAFFVAAVGWCGARLEPCFESRSERNCFEYFGVWRRLG